MKHVGVREFKDHADALINAAEPLVIERHGQSVGGYLPLPHADKAAAAAAAARLADTLAAIQARLGLSEDELVAAFLESE